VSKNKTSPLLCFFWVRDQFLPETVCTAAHASVLLALASFANPNGSSIRPGNLRLMAVTKLSESELKRAIRSWKKHPSGVLREQSTGNGQGHASEFCIHMFDVEPKGVPVDPLQGVHTEPLQGEQRGSERGSRRTPSDAKGVHEGVHEGVHVHEPPPNHRTTELLKKEAVAKTAPFVLPDWVPLQAWNDWLEMRKLVFKKAVTRAALKIALTHLERLANEGHNPRLVLEQSTLNNWQGLWPLRKSKPKLTADQYTANVVANSGLPGIKNRFN